MTLDLRILPQDGETGKTANQSTLLVTTLKRDTWQPIRPLWSVHHGKWHLLNALFMALHSLVIN